jgi:hypothetical protein
MALLTQRILNNGAEASYHKIVNLQLNIDASQLHITWVGFKDKNFRDANWQPGNTDKTAAYIDDLFISGQDFIDNILPHINEAGAVPFSYNLLKDRVDYLKDATSDL